jgi:hypothetical protein
MRHFKILFASVCILILQLGAITSSSAADPSTLTFSWFDNESTDLNRTFYQSQVLPGEANWWDIKVLTQDSSWSGQSISLEKSVNGSWQYLTSRPLYDFSGAAHTGLTSAFTIDSLCGNRTWCSGKYLYRFKFGSLVLKEFAVTFIPVKSNLKIKLSTDREQAWGTVHTLKAAITPKVSVKCTVERNGENIGNLQVKNGSGELKFTALAYQKPATGRSVVTLYAVCKAGTYYGASELGFVLFVP